MISALTYDDDCYARQMNVVKFKVCVVICDVCVTGVETCLANTHYYIICDRVLP